MRQTSESSYILIALSGLGNGWVLHLSGDSLVRQSSLRLYSWRRFLVLNRDLAHVDHLLQDVPSLFGVWVFRKQLVCLEQVELHLLILGLVKCYPWLEVAALARLSVEHLKGGVVSEVEIGRDLWEFIIRQAHFITTMGIRTVLAETTLPFLEEVLALLRLEVVVRDVHHFELHF